MHTEAMLCFLYSRIFCEQGSLKFFLLRTEYLHHHKRFPFIKIISLIHIHPLCWEGFTKKNIQLKLCFHLRIYWDIFILFHSEGFTKTLQKKLLCLLWNFTSLCIKISFTFTAVWKTKLQGFTVLPFHCCVKQFMVLKQTTPGFLHLLLLLHCCAFFAFLTLQKGFYAAAFSPWTSFAAADSGSSPPRVQL